MCLGGTTTLAHSQSSMAIDWLLLLLQYCSPVSCEQCPWNGSGHCNSPRFIYPTIHIQKLVTLTLKKTEQLKKTVQHWMCLSWLAIHTYTYLCVRVYVCVHIYISQYIYTPKWFPKCYNFIILHIDIYIYIYVYIYVYIPTVPTYTQCSQVVAWILSSLERHVSEWC